jgi:tRNA(Arg) A34 adenosine deaminase TadA
MNTALDMARSAKEHGEVAVGCVFYHIPSDAIIVKSGNLTNATNNVIPLTQTANCSLRNQLH